MYVLTGLVREGKLRRNRPILPSAAELDAYRKESILSSSQAGMLGTPDKHGNIVIRGDGVDPALPPLGCTIINRSSSSGSSKTGALLTTSRADSNKRQQQTPGSSEGRARNKSDNVNQHRQKSGSCADKGLRTGTETGDIVTRNSVVGHATSTTAGEADGKDIRVVGVGAGGSLAHAIDPSDHLAEDTAVFGEAIVNTRSETGLVSGGATGSVRAPDAIIATVVEEETGSAGPVGNAGDASVWGPRGKSEEVSRAACGASTRARGDSRSAEEIVVATKDREELAAVATEVTQEEGTGRRPGKKREFRRALAAAGALLKSFSRREDRTGTSGDASDSDGANSQGVAIASQSLGAAPQVEALGVSAAAAATNVGVETHDNPASISNLIPLASEKMRGRRQRVGSGAGVGEATLNAPRIQGKAIRSVLSTSTDLGPGVSTSQEESSCHAAPAGLRNEAIDQPLPIFPGNCGTKESDASGFYNPGPTFRAGEACSDRGKRGRKKKMVLDASVVTVEDTVGPESILALVGDRGIHQV